MSAPTLADDAAVGPPERLHPLFLLKGLGGSLRGLAGLYAFIGYLLISGQWQTAIIAAVGFFAIGIVGVILYWTRFEYRVGQREIRIDSGILSRRHRSIPFDRIQDVDITQGPVARLLGLAEVKFETGGGGAGPNSEEGVLHAITLERAHQLRELIRSSRGREVLLEPVAEAEQPTVYAMGLKRLLAAGAFNFSLAVFAGLIGVTQTFGDALGFDPLSQRFWRSLLAASAPVQEYVLAHRAVAVVAGLAVLILIGVATGVVRTALRDYGFRLDRTEAGLRRRRGLLTRTDVTLPLKRAQAALVTTGPVRAAFGWSELSLKSLATDEGGRGAHVVAPLGREEEIDHILAELGWRRLPKQADWRRVSRAYVWMRAIALSPLFAVAGLQAGAIAVLPVTENARMTDPSVAAIAPLAATALIIIVGGTLAILLRWFDWLRTGYALDQDRLLVRTGWWRRRLLILPFARIQSADVTESFVSRWFGTATLRFGVAGGSMRGEIIPAIPSATARQLRDELIGSRS